MAKGNFGERLKREREMREVSLAEVTAGTRIGPKFLEALENEEWEKLPGGIFSRGFVRSIARYLGLDEEDFLAEYDLARGEQQIAAPAPYTNPIPSPSKWIPALALLAIIALIYGGVHGTRYAWHRFTLTKEGHSESKLTHSADAPANAATSPPANSTGTTSANSIAKSQPPQALPAVTGMPAGAGAPANGLPAGAGPATSSANSTSPKVVAPANANAANSKLSNTGVAGDRPGGTTSGIGSLAAPNGAAGSKLSAGAGLPAGATGAASTSAVARGAASAPAIAARPLPAVAGQRLELTLSTSAPSRVRVVADRRVLLDRGMRPGDTRHFSAKNEFQIRAQHTAALHLVLNGQPVTSKQPTGDAAGSSDTIVLGFKDLKPTADGTSRP